MQMASDFVSNIFDGLSINDCEGSTSEINSSATLMHRFKENVSNDDVIVDADDCDYILPPNISTPNREVLGVSFFVPLRDMFSAAHIKISKFTGGTSHCFLTNEKSLPSELGMKQNNILRFRADKEDHDQYPLSFRSLSNNKQKKSLDHALHYTVYPKRRMKRSVFNVLIQNLSGPLCKLEAGGGSASFTSDWDPPRTAAPSSLRMRFVCEALQSFVKTTKSTNDALLAYLLYHHIGAEDISFDQYERDSSFSRIIYRAVASFESPMYLGPVAETAYADIMDDMHKFLSVTDSDDCLCKAIY